MTLLFWTLSRLYSETTGGRQSFLWLWRWRHYRGLFLSGSLQRRSNSGFWQWSSDLAESRQSLRNSQKKSGRSEEKIEKWIKKVVLIILLSYVQWVAMSPTSIDIGFCLYSRNMNGNHFPNFPIENFSLRSLFAKKFVSSFIDNWISTLSLQNSYDMKIWNSGIVLISYKYSL